MNTYMCIGIDALNYWVLNTKVIKISNEKNWS